METNTAVNNFRGKIPRFMHPKTVLLQLKKYARTAQEFGTKLRHRLQKALHTPQIARIPKDSALALVALGVVYGDIGTSPLYALKECFFNKTHGVSPTPENIYGILSLVFWSLMIVVTFKYLTKVMRAENHGEGGILALLALVVSGKDTGKISNALRWFALGGAALLFADGFITPVISVYGSVEGAVTYNLIPKNWTPYLVTGILIGLFVVQQFGTERVGRVFGPIMLVWFLVIGALGLPAIVHNPEILRAINPYYALSFFSHHHWHGFLTLGLVVLVITGGEALYADMGHFGRRTITIAWYAVVLPGLLLSYFGQGAWLLGHQNALSTEIDPLFVLAPVWFQKPFVILAVAAAIIASQALISGAFSLCRQLVQQGFFPRVEIRHTSCDHEGQIYAPLINWALCTGCLALAYLFRSTGSSGLATAYGIAVTGTMSITSVLYGFWLVRCQKWRPQTAGLLTALFLVVDLAFFGANTVKFFDGGYLPIGVALMLFTLMSTWYICRRLLKEKLFASSITIKQFIEDERFPLTSRVKGVAIVMTSIEGVVGNALMHNYKHNKVLHETILFLTMVTKRKPEIPAAERLKITDYGHGVYDLNAYYGFMQTPSVLEVLKIARSQGVPIGDDRSYFLGRETTIVRAGYHKELSRWRAGIFWFISKFAIPAANYFGIPWNQVVELGMYVEI